MNKSLLTSPRRKGNLKQNNWILMMSILWALQKAPEISFQTLNFLKPRQVFLPARNDYSEQRHLTKFGKSCNAI